MSDNACPFCARPDSRLFYESETTFALWDIYPVSPGHALIIPKRHIATWFDADDGEQADLMQSLRVVKAIIDNKHAPEGYNIGINVGEVAGQTVFHLHIHVIPRYRGDIPNPRGGVRRVLPGRGSYPPKVPEDT